MNAQQRHEIMQGCAASAKRENERGDVVMRTQASNTWYELATPSEASRAPAYLTWLGRR